MEILSKHNYYCLLTICIENVMLLYYLSEEDGCAKFYLRFLGSVEVNYHKGDEVLCQAINKVNSAHFRHSQV